MLKVTKILFSLYYTEIYTVKTVSYLCFFPSQILKSCPQSTNETRYGILLKIIANRMDLHNLAIVFSPNIVYAGARGARAEQVLLYMEWNNLIVELLLDNVDLIFEK